MTRHKPLLPKALPTAHDLPKGWWWADLGKALEQRKQFILVEDEERYQRVTVQLHGRGILPRDHVLGKAIKTKKQQVVAAHDFLVAEIDAKMGGFGIVPASLAGGIVSSHYFTFAINTDLLLPAFLEVFIRTGFLTRAILVHVRGSLNYAAIRPRHVLGIQFPFAEPTTQETLIAQIKQVDLARAALNEQLGILDAMPAAFIRAALGGAVPNP